MVTASWADPALPLARWRARGELAEIRAAELRFTSDEAAAYLTAMMGLHLSAREVAALEGRTEGWIAALQLAALLMQGRDDVAGFIAGFAGGDCYVVDYLAEEVLARQCDRVQAFLLQTCILGRLNGPLCDAVTGQGGGKAMLAALDSYAPSAGGTSESSRRGGAMPGWLPFEIEGEPSEVTPTTCQVRQIQQSRSLIPVPSASPTRRTFGSGRPAS
jgi:hypothetical protein